MYYNFKFWLNSVKFEQSCLAFSFARRLLQGRLGGWLGGWPGMNLIIVIALASLEPINYKESVLNKLEN